MRTALSIIIPVGPGDFAWKALLSDLFPLLPEAFKRAEVIMVGTTEAPAFWDTVSQDSPVEVRWLKAKKGRAIQMNAGAQAARGEVLWFLHADSRLGAAAIQALFRALQAHPDALHFFNLMFQDDGPRLIQLNTIGVWFRSRILRLPFGDQGFFLSGESFRRLGEFDESADFGEDHLLVWKAKQLRVPLRCSGAWISTSARKYREHGWGRTTIQHLLLTAWQGTPEFFKWVGSRAPW